MSQGRVGRVLGSEHTTTAEFRVVLEEEEYLQLDDLIVVRTEVPKVGEVRTYGVITEAEAVYEGAQYESDTHRIAELGIMPAAKVRTARVAVTRVDPEVWVSADPGEEVARATGEERRKALYADEMERPLPIGSHAMPIRGAIISPKPNFKRKFGSWAVRSPVLSKASARRPRLMMRRSLIRTRSWRKRASS